MNEANLESHGRQPLVSVIVPAYNAEGTLAEALESALGQTYKNIEVIAVDDGSTDGTWAVISRYAGRVKAVRQENRGVYATRNSGAAEARGAYVAFLDADDVWRADKIDKQMAAFERFPRVILTASRVVCVDKEGKNLPSPPQGGLAGRYDASRRFYKSLLMKGNFIPLSSVVVRKEPFLASGGFYAHRRILSADYDMWIRLAERSDFCILSEPLALYRVTPDSLLHGSLEKEYGAQRRILERNKARYTPPAYRRRLSRLYSDWADSALDRTDPEAWNRLKVSLTLDWLNTASWGLGLIWLARRCLSLAARRVYALLPRRALLRRRPEVADKVYLTFDDGPTPGNTERILDILKQKKACATFFMTGREVPRNQEIVRRAVCEGHELASHGWSHARDPFFGFRSVWKEFQKTRDALFDAAGKVTRLHRPPYGRLTLPLLLYSLLGKIRIVLWSLDSDDDRDRTAGRVLEKCRGAQGGDILLFHDDNAAIIEALPTLIDELRGRGLAFGRIGEVER